MVNSEGSHAVTLGEEISSETADEIKELMKPLDGLTNGAGTHLVETAWQTLVQAVESLPQLPSSRGTDAMALEALATWLSAFRTYLNHQETYWKRQYPNLWPTIQRATAVEFDRPDKSYAIICSLRNYTDHVSTAGISISRSLDPRTGRTVAALMGNRDTLLALHDGWHRSVIPVLRAKDEAFDLMPISTAAMFGLGRIHEVASNLLLLLAKNSIDPLRGWADRAPRPEPGVTGCPSLVWTNVGTSTPTVGKDLRMNTVALMSHFRLDALELALCDQSDPLAAAREFFNGNMK